MSAGPVPSPSILPLCADLREPAHREHTKRNLQAARKLPPAHPKSPETAVWARSSRHVGLGGEFVPGRAPQSLSGVGETARRVTTRRRWLHRPNPGPRHPGHACGDPAGLLSLATGPAVLTHPPADRRPARHD